jgi:hypothetical protein
MTLVEGRALAQVAGRRLVIMETPAQFRVAANAIRSGQRGIRARFFRNSSAFPCLSLSHSSPL